MIDEKYKTYKKYIKYKQKYLNLQTGGAADIILLDGTSSSGKTTIGKLYEQHGYKHITGDDFHDQSLVEVIKKLPNEYISQQSLQELRSYELRRLVFEESQKYKKVVIDDINQKILQFFKRNEIYIVVVYASLNDLINNIIRRKLIEPRGLFVFTQYAKRYTKTDSKSLDTVNRKDFTENLKQLKQEFESETELIKFATKIFADLGISDDDNHYIKLKDNYQADYIVKTHGKSPNEIYEEIKEKTDK
jgi:adenylate kinase family enzyme